MTFASYFIVLLLLFTFYLTGSIIFILTNLKSYQDRFYNTFVKLILGFMTISFVYAAYKTGGNTVLWGFVIVGFLSLIILKRKNYINVDKFKLTDINPKQYSIPFIVLIVLSAVLFIIFGGLFYSETYTNMPHTDYYYYARLINSMIEHGAESSIYNINPFYQGIAYASPYHYPELWLAGFITEIFAVLPLESLVVIVNVIFGSILVTGIIALSRTISNTSLIALLGLISLFFSGLLIIDVLPQTRSFFELGSIYTPKCSIISIFFVWATCLLIKKTEEFYLPLLILPIVNIGMAPAIFSSLVIFYVIKSIKQGSIRQYIYPFVSIIITAIFIALFYLLQSSGLDGAFGLSNIMEVHSQIPFKIIEVIFGAFFMVFILYFWYFIPVLIPIFAGKSKFWIKYADGINNLVLLFVIILFVSVLIWGVTNPMPDSNQFHSMPVYFWLNILVFVFFAITYEAIKGYAIKIKAIFWISVIALISLNVYQLNEKAFIRYYKITDRRSEPYIKSVLEIHNSLNNKTGALIKPTIYINNVFQTNTYWNPSFADNFIGDFNLVNISTFNYVVPQDDIVLKARAKNALKHATFEIFSRDWEKLYGKTSKDSLQYYYVTENKISFIVIGNRAELPEVFEEHVELEIYDSISGEKFVLLKKL